MSTNDDTTRLLRGEKKHSKTIIFTKEQHVVTIVNSRQNHTTDHTLQTDVGYVIFIESPTTHVHCTLYK